MNPLSKCTDEEIELEAFRRRELRIKNKHKLKFCDECVHFRINDTGEELSDDELMKACNLGHKTHFVLPEHPSDDDWGFYRTPCTDREIAIDRKWPWQIEQEKLEKLKAEQDERVLKAKFKEWNQKLAERRLRTEQKLAY